MDLFGVGLLNYIRTYVQRSDKVRSWSIAEARANMADLSVSALSRPQKIEQRDGESVIVVAESVWNRLVVEYQTFSHLVPNAPIEDEDLPQRQLARVISGSSDA
jgi:hypothetical protein